ncbi:hypothetical protein [Bacillus horti]|uniref:Uncharacterized protein n=1 Tax=Caldalkalibacillus horti TaxID=77523 RepID=A0ABT9VXJ2_9BACI|nr:hypothetical protein [Bacillus horti]MDQ0165715.1 hypothetical protein [Bacillus horti]
MSLRRLKRYVGKYVFVRIRGKRKGFPSFVEEVQTTAPGRNWITLWECYRCAGPVQILYQTNQIASIRVVNDPLSENKCNNCKKRKKKR